MISFSPSILNIWLRNVFTVAPLTTTVIGSVPDHFSGTASDINNAVTRIASVFTNAIFGALAILTFSIFLNKEIKSLALTPHVKQTVVAEAVNPGNAKVPSTVNTQSKSLIQKSYINGFITAYANVMGICAALAFLGTMM